MQTYLNFTSSSSENNWISKLLLLVKISICMHKCCRTGLKLCNCCIWYNIAAYFQIWLHFFSFFCLHDESLCHLTPDLGAILSNISYTNAFYQLLQLSVFLWMFLLCHRKRVRYFKCRFSASWWFIPLITLSCNGKRQTILTAHINCSGELDSYLIQ